MTDLEEPRSIADVIVTARARAMNDPDDWDAVYTMTCYDLVIAALKPQASARELTTLNAGVLDTALWQPIAQCDPFDLAQACATALYLARTTALDPALIEMFHAEFTRRGANRMGKVARWQFDRALRGGDAARATRILTKIGGTK